MGVREESGYCSYTKAIEHLGDRWSLLIVRQLGTFGPQGFNDLTAELPGRISRSVLADRLRRLQTLGLVARGGSQGPSPTYRLTEIGHGLMGPLGSLRDWAETWLPEDPGMMERDPDVVLGWLAQRADPDRAPRRPVVLELRPSLRLDHRYWLVLEGGRGGLRLPSRPAVGREPLRLRGRLDAGASRAGQGPVHLDGCIAGRLRDGRRRSRPCAPTGWVVPVRAASRAFRQQRCRHRGARSFAAG